MAKQLKPHTTIGSPSKLDKFDLKYELDVDWDAARKTTRKHTAKR